MTTGLRLILIGFAVISFGSVGFALPQADFKKFKAEFCPELTPVTPRQNSLPLLRGLCEGASSFKEFADSINKWKDACTQDVLGLKYDSKTLGTVCLDPVKQAESLMRAFVAGAQSANCSATGTTEGPSRSNNIAR